MGGFFDLLLLFFGPLSICLPSYSFYFVKETHIANFPAKSKRTYHLLNLTLHLVFFFFFGSERGDRSERIWVWISMDMDMNMNMERERNIYTH